MWAIARTRVPLGSLATAFRSEVHAIDPALPIQLGPFLLADRLAERYQYRALSGILFMVCAAVALVLASIGLYAVIAHSVSQRTQEIGIRTAVGATRGDVLRLVLSQGMRAVVAGLAAGFLAAVVLGRVLEGESRRWFPPTR